MAGLAATQGDRVATDRGDRAPAATEPNSVALACLNAALDWSGRADKVLAPDGVTPQTFSKMRHGVQAFPVALLDALPPIVVVEFCRSLLARHGYIVRAVDPADLTEELLVEAEKLTRLVKACRIARARPAKVEA